MSLICKKKGCTHKPFVKTHESGGCGHKLHYKFEIGGIPFGNSTRTANFAEAMKRHNIAYAKHEKEVHDMKEHPERVKEREEAKAKPAIPTFGEYVALPEGDFQGGLWWWKHGATARYRTEAETLRYYRNRITVLTRYQPLADCRLDRVDWDLLGGYVASRLGEVGNCTINQDMTCIHLVLRNAQKGRLIERLPEFPDRLKVPPRGRDISLEEEELYLGTIQDRGFHDLYLLALLALDAGCEPGKVTVERLDWMMVHLEKTWELPFGWLHNPFTKTITRERDLGIIDIRTHQALTARWLQAAKPKTGLVFKHPEHLHRPINYDTLKKQHDRLWQGPRALPIQKFRPYDLRHTFLTLGGESGLDSRGMKAISGHTSDKMTERYIHRNRNLMVISAGHMSRYRAKLKGILPDNPLLSLSDAELLRRIKQSPSLLRFLEQEA